MGFKKLPGNKGMIYIPYHRKSRSKHPCSDCFACNWCSNDRCLTCRPYSQQPERKKPKI